MTRALTYKEFRETLGVAAIGLIALVLIPASSSEHSPAPSLWQGQPGQIPFVSDSFNSRLGMVAFAFAAVLGFWQATRDFRGDAQLFLLQRPVSRSKVYSVKLAVGLVVYLVCVGVSILAYAASAATPGNHASPFTWSMTAPAWLIWASMSAVYFGAVLAGIRPAAWLGTRLAPVAAAGAIVFVAFLMSESLSYVAAAGLIVLADVALASCVGFVVQERDFA
jgi:hypothetical protein